MHALQGRPERSHLLFLTAIVGRRAFASFAAVSLVIVTLLCSVQIASRYALKQYAEDQLSRVPWDFSLYQASDVPFAEQTRRRIAQVEHVTEAQDIYFLRTSVPASTVAYVDGEPLRSPWLSVLSATDQTILPPEIRPSQRDGAVLVLIGSKAQMGDAYLQLQNKHRFELRVDKAHHGGTAFGVGLERTVRIDRNDVNRWFMDQTSSPTLVPELGVILVTAYDPKIITAFDAVSRGVEHHHDHEDPEETGRGDPIHASAGDYFPDIIHLARVDRAALISGWDLEGSYPRVATLGQKVRNAAQEVTFRIGIDNTSGVLLERMSRTARAVAAVSLLSALPLVWMAWVLLANLSALLLLNERRKFGLLRLRGVPGHTIGRAMQLAIAAGGMVGGVVGALLGTALPILIYARTWLPWDTIFKLQNPLAVVASLLIAVSVSLLVSRRLVRYAASISPLEASGRVTMSEAIEADVRFGWLQAAMLIVGSVKVASWMLGRSLAPIDAPSSLHTLERVLDFVAFPLFAYGLTSLLVSRRGWLVALLRPIGAAFGGRMRNFSLQHTALRPHRVSGLLLIVALMTSLSIYPTIMTAVFDDKIERAALVQLGAPVQVTVNVSDLVPAPLLAQRGMRERYGFVRDAAVKLITRLKSLPEVTNAGFMVEGLVDGLYMPGQGFNSVPVYLVDDPGAYLHAFYHEQSLGESASFSRLVSDLAQGRVVLSTAMASFWRRNAGDDMPIGRDTTGAMVKAPVAGTMHFMAGIPLAAVKDRESFVAARVDYLNHLFDSRGYMVAAANDPELAQLDVLLQRLVVTITPRPNTNFRDLRRALADAFIPAAPQFRDRDDEIARLGSDMYLFLARQNVQIYLIGGVLMAMIGILAIILTNYAEDRRTLALLRIRGCGPREVLQFMSSGLTAPAVIGLAFGGLLALVVGFGITNVIWTLREIKSIMLFLHTHLAVSTQTAVVAGSLIAILIMISIVVSRWLFKHTAREVLTDH